MTDIEKNKFSWWVGKIHSDGTITWVRWDKL